MDTSRRGFLWKRLALVALGVAFGAVIAHLYLINPQEHAPAEPARRIHDEGMVG